MMSTVRPTGTVRAQPLTSFAWLFRQERGVEVKKLSGTKFRQMLRAGEDIPEWFAFKSVVKVLRENI